MTEFSKRKIPGLKDSSGAFLKPSPVTPEPPKPEEPVTDVSIDALLLRGLNTIDRVMRCAMSEASTGTPSRESVMNLKDCMAMLHELKKKEDELLDDLSDEDLAKAAQDDDE